jgi:Tol biopolymer transport system component
MRATRSEGRSIYPAWSPDSERIAFTRTGGGEDELLAGIYVMNPNGTGVALEPKS